MLKVSSLHKTYGNNLVLKDVNIQFKKGNISGVVGENGSGKTTLFKCISGLESYKGTCEYGTEIIKNITGFLPTNPYFMSRISGKEYLQLLSNSRGVKVADFEEVNIFDLPLNKYAETYSTGMKKKLALTGVLLQKNQIFILDEPFNGVDIYSNVLITEVLQKLKEQGNTIILSSHMFSTLSQNCDVIYHLKNGEITKRLEPNEFSELELELKHVEIGSRLDRLHGFL